MAASTGDLSNFQTSKQRKKSNSIEPNCNLKKNGRESKESIQFGGLLCLEGCVKLLFIFQIMFAEFKKKRAKYTKKTKRAQRNNSPDQERRTKRVAKKKLCD